MICPVISINHRIRGRRYDPCRADKVTGYVIPVKPSSAVTGGRFNDHDRQRILSAQPLRARLWPVPSPHEILKTISHGQVSFTAQLKCLIL
jgi:hypothetical protein